MMAEIVQWITLLLLIFVDSCFSSLCSSSEYSNSLRNILSLQSDYHTYEGKLIFLQNESLPQANPSGIYGTVIFGDNPNITYKRELIDYTYFFRASNALVFSGCTPPKSIYFSMVSYLFNRYSLSINNHTYYDRNLFASLGSALNHFVWNTSNSNNNSNNNNAFNSLTTYIQTADKQTYMDITNLLTNNSIYNVSLNEINLQSLPNKYINFLPYNYNSDNIYSYNESFDTGTIIFRVTLPDNRTQYMKYINTNQTVFMLEPKIHSKTKTKFQFAIDGETQTPRIPYNLSIRNTYSNNNLNETSSIYNKILNEYKINLINYLTLNQSMTYINQHTFGYAQNCQNQSLCYGILCIVYNHECLGDNRDTLYSNPMLYDSNGNSKELELTLYNNSFYILLGIMHSNNDINQTIYSSITYYDHHETPLNNYNNPHITDIEYNGSSLLLPFANDTNIDERYLQNIFVVQLAPINNCVFLKYNLSSNLCIKNFYSKNISYGTFNYRNYLNPKTKTRPDIQQMIPTILLNFTL